MKTAIILFMILAAILAVLTIVTVIAALRKHKEKDVARRIVCKTNSVHPQGKKDIISTFDSYYDPELDVYRTRFTTTINGTRFTETGKVQNEAQSKK